jgi:hypothetical protein
MFAKDPQVPGPGHRRLALGRGRHRVRPGFVGWRFRTIQQQVDLGRREAGDLEVEVELQAGELLELERETRLVPAGVLGQPVVGQDEGAPLRITQVLQPHRRNLGDPEKLRGLDSGVAGNYRVPRIDQDGDVEAEPPDALGDLPDLLLRMGAGVARIRTEVVQRSVLDLEALLTLGPGCGRLWICKPGSHGPGSRSRIGIPGLNSGKSQNRRS